MQAMEAVSMIVSTLMIIMNAGVEVATDCPATEKAALVKFLIQLLP